jgi:hypothetical protein
VGRLRRHDTIRRTQACLPGRGVTSWRISGSPDRASLLEWSGLLDIGFDSLCRSGLALGGGECSQARKRLSALVETPKHPTDDSELTRRVFVGLLAEMQNANEVSSSLNDAGEARDIERACPSSVACGAGISSA